MHSRPSVCASTVLGPPRQQGDPEHRCHGCCGCAGERLAPATCIPKALPKPLFRGSVAWRQGATERQPEAPSPFADVEAAGPSGPACAPAAAGGDGAADRAHDAGHLVSRGMSKRGVQGTQLMRSAAESDSALLLGGDLGVVVVQARPHHDTLNPSTARALSWFQGRARTRPRACPVGPAASWGATPQLLPR